MAKSLEVKLPKYLRKAIKDKVLTLPEAELWMASVTVQCHLPLVLLPKALHSAASRVWLWEQPGRKQ